MVIGVLRVRLALFGATSLKDKRRVTRSVKDRLRNKHNVSVAEVDDLDHRQAATLGIAMIGNEIPFLQSALNKIADELRGVPEASLVDFGIEFF
jgi:uncharacterized protein YlxP (DUF503 family)